MSIHIGPARPAPPNGLSFSPHLSTVAQKPQYRSDRFSKLIQWLVFAAHIACKIASGPFRPCTDGQRRRLFNFPLIRDLRLEWIEIFIPSSPSRKRPGELRQQRLVFGLSRKNVARQCPPVMGLDRLLADPRRCDRCISSAP